MDDDEREVIEETWHDGPLVGWRMRCALCAKPILTLAPETGPTLHVCASCEWDVMAGRINQKCRPEA